MARFFTSDWHLNERRIGEFNPFFRPFKSVEEENSVIISNINETVGEDDTLYVLGDVAVDDEGIALLEKIECKNMVLIVGNYDEDKLEKLRRFFKSVRNEMDIEIDGIRCHLNHYPVNKVEGRFNIVGHVHDLWKVKKDMVNVSVDTWNFRPVSEKQLMFVYDAIRNHYDENVFLGENTIAR